MQGPLGGEQLIRRAVELAVAAVLVAASLTHAPCDTMRVNLGVVAPALPTSAQRQVRSISKRQMMVRISQPGFCSSVSSGDPALPCKLIYVALPPDADPGSVRIIPGSYSTAAVPGSYDIAPVPVAATSDGGLHWGPGKSLTAGRNRGTYGRNSFYPAQQVRLVGVGNLRTWKIAVLEFWPYSYNPSTGQLRAVTSDAAQLSYSCRSTRAPRPADPAAYTMSGFVENRAAAAQWYGAASSPSTTGYAIIITSAIASASMELADFAASLSSRGFTVNVATESDWGGGIGDVAAEHIRAWLKANYFTLGLQYVLLIGNPDPTTGDVPMKMLWPRKWSSSYREAPSDYYYSDLTGNWDLDGDGYAGEEPDDFGIGGIDRIPEVYVGRIPCYGNIAELDSILLKTLVYKSTGHGDWGRKCLMAMKPMDDSTPSYQLGEEITADFLSEMDANPDRVYEDTYGLQTPPERHPCDYDMVLNEWAPGAGLVFWMTHGSYNTATSVFISSRCAYLDDSKPSVVYMASCSNGQPEYPGNLGYSVLAKGGATTLSASRVSWYYLGETDFRSTDSVGGLGYQYARFLTRGQEPCGRAAMDARLANPTGIWPNHLVFNLYGDPSVVYDIRRTVADAKHAPDDTSVKIDFCLVSRMGDGPECYVEDVSRCAGIRISGAWGGVLKLDPGTKVSITGQIATENRMRLIRNAQVTITGGSGSVGPIGMLNQDVGDPKNLGLLVMAWGRVVSASGGSFVISDGSLESGLRVTCHGSASAPSSGYVKVTGISTADGLAVYTAGDIAGIGN